VVLPILLALAFLLLLFALVVGLLIYIPLLPLFIQVWILQLFGVVNMGHALPIITLIIVLGFVLQKFIINSQCPSQMQIIWIAFGLILLYTGATKFGYVWEILQFKHHYHINSDNMFFQSSCADYTTTCLTHDDRSPYPDQLLPAIGAELLWYGGIVLSWYGMNSSDTDDISNTTKTIVSVISDVKSHIRNRL